MSIHRTLKLRGLNPLEEIVRALEAYIRHGKLPPLPEAVSNPTPADPAPPDPAPQPDG